MLALLFSSPSSSSLSSSSSASTVVGDRDLSAANRNHDDLIADQRETGRTERHDALEAEATAAAAAAAAGAAKAGVMGAGVCASS